jgi:hypothetical protein
MRIPWRALPAAALLALTLGPAPHASAGWTCSFYKWNATQGRWSRAALLVDEDWYLAQPGHARWQSWDCEYCYIPAGIPPAPSSVVATGSGGGGGSVVPAGPPPASLVEPVRTALDPFWRALGDPWGPPPSCPPVPPEYDGLADALPPVA